jgi:GT2 family glycosyltransferase
LKSGLYAKSPSTPEVAQALKKRVPRLGALGRDISRFWGILARHVRDRRSFERALTFGWRVYREEGAGGVVQTLRASIRRVDSLHRQYQRWIALYDTITNDDLAAMRRHVATFATRPLISVVMPVYNTPQNLLYEAIESVRAQVYENWELCIADDSSTNPHVRRILDEYVRKEPRIKVVHRQINGHISRASNDALALASGDWVALLDHDDLLRPHSLYCVADAINRNPEALLFYSDEDKIDEYGRSDPYFKCDWNEGLFYGHNMFSHLGVYKRSLLNEVGGFRAGLEGAQDYDLVLRCIERVERQAIIHIPRILYHWRINLGSTASSPGEKNYAIVAAERALNEYFTRRGIAAQVEEMPARGMTRARFAVPEPTPFVSIIIPTRNGRKLLETCIGSIRERTSYPNFEIVIVDHRSDDGDTLAYLNEIETSGTARILKYDNEFNFSAINNFAVRHSSGDFICLLNNDTEVIAEDWLTEMVGCALQPGVGVVGAMLRYPNDTIQHAGVVLGLTGVAGHVYAGQPANYPGMMCRAHLSQEMTAITAACCLVRRSIYEEVGGLDEENLKIAYNDVDLCLRVREAGYRNYWTPHAVLYHHESMTRGYETTPEKQERFLREQAYMKKRWLHWIANDPAFSPNLSLDRNDVALAFPPRLESPWVEA